MEESSNVDSRTGGRGQTAKEVSHVLDIGAVVGTGQRVELRQTTNGLHMDLVIDSG